MLKLMIKYLHVFGRLKSSKICAVQKRQNFDVSFICASQTFSKNKCMSAIPKKSMQIYNMNILKTSTIVTLFKKVLALLFPKNKNLGVNAPSIIIDIFSKDVQKALK